MSSLIGRSSFDAKWKVTVPEFVRAKLGAAAGDAVRYYADGDRVYITATRRGEPEGPALDPVERLRRLPDPFTRPVVPAPVLAQPGTLAGQRTAAHGTGTAVPPPLPAKPRTKLAAARAEFDGLMSEYDAGDCGARARGIAFKREQMQDRNLGTDAADWVVYPRQTRDGCASKDFCDRDHRTQASESV